MGEKVDKRIYRSFQKSSNLSSVWRQGEASRTPPLSANSNNNYMGRRSLTLDGLHNENGFYQGNGASRTEKISFQNANYPGKQNYDDGTECVRSSSNSKCNGINERRKDREIYVRSINPQWNKDRNNVRENAVQEQQINSNVEGEKYTDIKMVQFECCPNRERIRSLQLSLGQLRRNGALAGNAWTKENPKTPCRLVVPNVQSTEARIPDTMSHVPKGEKQDESREDCNIPKMKNPLMLVEMIANKKDRKRVANYFNRDGSGDPFTCICYMEMVKLYGFDHIIFIGECYAGILFLDCYGRVFEWDSMSNVLWSLGDYWTSKESPTRDVIWSVEYDGTVTEFKDTMDDLPNELTFDEDEPATKTVDVYPVAKKKKNSKKNNSKKKH